MLADMWDFLWQRVFSVLNVSILTSLQYFFLAGKKERDREKKAIYLR